MRPVNLLPEEHQPRKGGRRLTGGSYVVLGVLGALLVMVLGYVLLSNQVNSRKSEIAHAKQETDEAKARTAQLAPYAAFSRIKETRLQAVKEQAAGRFDWERLMRELALLLPSDIWVTNMSASTDPEDSTSGGTPPTAGSSTASSSPSVQLAGCARNQPDVAVLMVRLRKLDRATDVELTESAEQGAGGGAAPSAGAASSGGSSSSGGGASDGCPDDRFQFDVTVTFSPASPGGESPGRRRVPTSLGGGS
jgi:Tfp pilus assembly protein PilN